MSKILVVDDDTSVRELLYERLTQKGHEVLAAGSGAQALELLKTNRPDYILLDSAMPGVSGLETAEKIRAFDDGVPIALLKGAGEPELDGTHLARVGIAQVVSKKLAAEPFLMAVELTLKRLEGHTPAPGKEPVMRGLGTILAVDDDILVLTMLKGVLESRGFQVIPASSGEAALEALAKRPDLVLLDVNMPGMDGVMTLKKIKAMQASLPVIMASAVDEQATVRDALALGAYDYITKPFNLEYLETVVLTKVLLGMEG